MRSPLSVLLAASLVCGLVFAEEAAKPPPKVADAIPTPLFGHSACFERMTREQKVGLARDFLKTALKDKKYPTAMQGVDLSKAPGTSLFGVVMEMIYAEHLTEVREEVYLTVVVGEEIDKLEVGHFQKFGAKQDVVAVVLVALDGSGKKLMALIEKNEMGAPALFKAYLTAGDWDSKKIEKLAEISGKKEYREDGKKTWDENNYESTRAEVRENIFWNLHNVIDYISEEDRKDGFKERAFEQKIESIHASTILAGWHPKPYNAYAYSNEPTPAGFDIFAYLNYTTVIARTDLRALAKENYSAVEHHIRTADLGMADEIGTKNEKPWDEEKRAWYRKHLLMLIEDLDPNKKQTGADPARKAPLVPSPNEPADEGNALPLDEKTKNEMAKMLEEKYPELKGVDFTTKAGVRKLYEAQLRREYPELKNVDLATPEGKKRVEQLVLAHHRAELDEAYPELKGMDLTSAEGRKKLDEAIKKDHENFTKRNIMLRGRVINNYSEPKYLNQDPAPTNHPAGKTLENGPPNTAQKKA